MLEFQFTTETLCFIFTLAYLGQLIFGSVFGNVPLADKRELKRSLEDQIICPRRA